MPIITNQATITYQSNGINQTAISNIASTNLEGPFSVGKTSLGDTYELNNEITYILQTTNNGSVTLTNVQITDDLGLGALTYVGPAQLYLNGILSNNLNITQTNNQVTFTIPSLTPNTTAMIIYRANPNNYAPLDVGSTITNTASWIATSVTDPTTATNTVTVEEAANVSITKAMTPDPITAGGIITYTFNLTNIGNIPAQNVILTDTFNPAPTNITVYVNGTILDGTDYTYTNGQLTINNNLTVPQATYITNPDNTITINPGTTQIIVTGTI